jgi:hypothetical protein
MTGDAVAPMPWIVLVGGFLGAGKTTLILAAARELERLGQRSAVILNDQGSALVDTQLTARHGMHSGEVTGGCFCCKFSDLIEVAEKLRAHSPQVVFAEPVGSCADIVATVLRPLQEHRQSYRVAPFTVLVDPSRARSLLNKGSDPKMEFLFRKQIEEADLICLSKSDLYPSNPPMLGRPLRQISAASGQGVLPWLHEILSGTLISGWEALEIDYEQYALAEAALTWLNVHAHFEPENLLSSAMVLGRLLDSLDESLTGAGIIIVHLKGIASSPAGFVKAAICGNGEEPRLEGNLDASPSSKHELLLNLRAVGAADRVRGVVEGALRKISGRLSRVTLDCFTPKQPIPERRVLRDTRSRSETLSS